MSHTPKQTTQLFTRRTIPLDYAYYKIKADITEHHQLIQMDGKQRNAYLEKHNLHWIMDTPNKIMHQLLRPLFDAYENKHGVVTNLYSLLLERIDNKKDWVLDNLKIVPNLRMHSKTRKGISHNRFDTPEQEQKYRNELQRKNVPQVLKKALEDDIRTITKQANKASATLDEIIQNSAVLIRTGTISDEAYKTMLKSFKSTMKTKDFDLLMSITQWRISTIN